MDKIMEDNKQPSTGNSFFIPSETKEGLVQRRWSTPIDASLANFPLLGCCFITGLLDTTMFQGKLITYFFM